MMVADFFVADDPDLDREMESAANELAAVLVSDAGFSQVQAEAIAGAIVGAVMPAIDRLDGQVLWLSMLALLDAAPGHIRSVLDLVTLKQVAQRMLLAEWRKSAPASMVELVDLARDGKHEELHAALERWRAKKD